MKIAHAGMLLLAATALFACEAPPMEGNEQRASLMPEPAARQILAKYVGEGWLANPYVEQDGLFCSGRINVRIDQLQLLKSPGGDYVVYYSGGGRCNRGFYETIGTGNLKRVRTREDEDELVDAFASLGAKIVK